MLGREVRIPAEIVMGVVQEPNGKTHGEVVSKMRSRMTKAHALAKNTSLIALSVKRIYMMLREPCSNINLGTLSGI